MSWQDDNLRHLLKMQKWMDTPACAPCFCTGECLHGGVCPNARQVGIRTTKTSTPCKECGR